MTNFEYLTTQLNVIEELTKRGVVSFTVIRDIDIYQAFLDLGKKNFSNAGRYAVLSHHFQLSEKRIEQIILGLSK